MTGLLASVRSPAEAEIALGADADIIDLKDPSAGALGALPLATIREAVAGIAGRRPVSATAGDLPMHPATVAEAVRRIAGTGVDYVKVGLFAGGDRVGCLDALARLAADGTRIVAVMFAELALDLGLAGALAARRFAGVMLDTADKRGGGLRDRLDDAALGGFVRDARRNGLLCGLAGSLRLDDVAPLLRHRPDYLGFRGALCATGRATALDPARIAALRAAIGPAHRSAATSAATAAAGAQRAAHSRFAASPSTSSLKSL